MTSTSKLFVLTSLAIGFSTAAMATPTYNPKTMSCAAVQQTIRDNGAVTLRYMSKRVKDLR